MSAAGMNARLMKLGIPVVFQNIIIGVGGLVVQYVINGYGFLFVAGFTATNKLYGLLEWQRFPMDMPLLLTWARIWEPERPTGSGKESAAVCCFPCLPH